MESTNEAGESMFVPATATQLFKLVKLEEIAVYGDTVSSRELSVAKSLPLTRALTENDFNDQARMKRTIVFCLLL
jgi:hypothetical protein